MTPFDLTGKKAFVTGASRGIGQAIAAGLARAGADVAVVARSEDGLAGTAKQIAGCGREAHVIPADVTRQEAVEAAVARGFMTAAQGTAAKLWLGARAEKDERGFKVRLPLTIQDGFLSMGPVKLARLPVVAWQ